MIRAQTKDEPTLRPDPDESGGRTLNARDLVAGDDTVRIMLDDKIYTLRITRADKLILTK